MGLSWTLPTATPTPAPVPADKGTSDLYGYDILFKKGNLPLNAQGDYTRVGGLENLRAAILRRLTTRPGEFKFRPNYGVGVQNWVRKVKNQANLEALQLRCIEQLSQDSRIETVDVKCTPITVNGIEALRVVVSVTTGGQPHTFEPFTFSEAA